MHQRMAGRRRTSALTERVGSGALGVLWAQAAAAHSALGETVGGDREEACQLFGVLGLQLNRAFVI